MPIGVEKGVAGAEWEQAFPPRVGRFYIILQNHADGPDRGEGVRVAINGPVFTGDDDDGLVLHSVNANPNKDSGLVTLTLPTYNAVYVRREGAVDVPWRGIDL